MGYWSILSLTLNKIKPQILKHNHHSGSLPHTFPIFCLWYLLGWTMSSLQECVLLLCEKEGMPVGGGGQGLQAALAMMAIEDKTPQVARRTLGRPILHQHHQSDSPSPHRVRRPPSASVSSSGYFIPSIPSSCSQGVRQKQFNSVRTGLAESCSGDCPLKEEWARGLSPTNNIFSRSLGNINLKTPHIWSTKRGLSISGTHCASLSTWRRTSSVFILSQMRTKNTLTSSELPEFCSQ